GKAEAVDEEVSESNFDTAKEARESCPVSVIDLS
ncbi:MAG: hypothetical protein K0R90_1112, partial [Oscillospiraceae bacterium]|nr:hypothetical protein [Oscillospiraceae bacterium]